MHVVQIAALQALGDAAHLLGAHLVERVSLDCTVIGQVGPPRLQRDPSPRRHQLVVGDVERQLARFGAQRTDIDHRRRSTLSVGQLQRRHLKARTACTDGPVDKHTRTVNNEPIESREVEIGGVAVVLEVAEPHKRAALEDETRITHRADVRAQMRKHVVPFDRLRRKVLAARPAIKLDKSPPCRRFQIASNGKRERRRKRSDASVRRLGLDLPREVAQSNDAVHRGESLGNTGCATRERGPRRDVEQGTLNCCSTWLWYTRTVYQRRQRQIG